MAAPAGYLALRTGLGQRVAGKLIRNIRPIKAARSFTDFVGGKAAGGAENVVFRQAGHLQRWANDKITRGTTWLTGVPDIPADLLKRKGQIKSQLLYATGKNKDHLLNELMRNKRSTAEVWTGRGALDRVDAWAKNKFGRVARRFGIPATGSMQRKGSSIGGIALDVKDNVAHSVPSPVSPKTGMGNWEAMLQRHHDVDRAWSQARKKGYGALDGIELTRLKNGSYRRRGGNFDLPVLNPSTPKTTITSVLTESAKRGRKVVTNPTLGSLQWRLENPDKLTSYELQQLRHHKSATKRQRQRIKAQLAELMRRNDEKIAKLMRGE